MHRICLEAPEQKSGKWLTLKVYFFISIINLKAYFPLEFTEEAFNHRQQGELKPVKMPDIYFIKYLDKVH